MMMIVGFVGLMFLMARIFDINPLAFFLGIALLVFASGV
jgi:hypothetical protein